MLTIRGRLITPFVLGSMSVGLNILIRHSFMVLWFWITALVPWPQLLSTKSYMNIVIIQTDLTSAFYQIPLSKPSMKYCGVATPFRWVRIYTRCAMGMPGSETALEEHMCRVLGDCIQDGVVVKLADDLYCEIPFKSYFLTGDTFCSYSKNAP